MKRRWLKIALTIAAGAAAPLVGHNDKRVSSVASAVVALGALYSRRPQDYHPSGHEPMPPYPLGHGNAPPMPTSPSDTRYPMGGYPKSPARPSPQDPPKS